MSWDSFRVTNILVLLVPLPCQRLPAFASPRSRPGSLAFEKNGQKELDLKHLFTTQIQRSSCWTYAAIELIHPTIPGMFSLCILSMQR